MHRDRARLTRRELLKLAGATLAGAVAAGCQPKVVEKIVKETVPVTVKETVPVTVKETVIVKEAPKVEVKGTFWVIQKQDFFPDMNAWFRSDIVKFCKEKNWPLDITYAEGYTGGTPFLEKLQASAASGMPPDMLMHTDVVSDMRRLNLIDPVNDIVEKVTGKWGDPSARQKYDFVIEGQWMAVPYFQRSDGGWFQRPAFEAKGVDIHKVRKYTDLWEACLAVSNPDKQLYGWGVTINRCGDGDWFRNRVQHGWGAYMQDASGKYVTINSPEMVEAMTVMTNLYKDKKWAPMLPPGVLSWTDPSNNEAYLAGKLAYTQNGGTVYGKAILDKNPVKDITGFHAPCGGPVNLEFNSLSANYFVLMKGAKNPEAARETMLHFLLPPENMDAIFANAPAFALPAYSKLWKESKFIPTNKVAQEQEKVATDPNGNIVAGFYPGPGYSPALATGNQMGIAADMVADILRGTPVKDAVKTCHDRYVRVFKEQKLPGEK